MHAGAWDGVTPDEARKGVDAARIDLDAGLGWRRVGLGLIQKRPRHGGADRLECLLAITDGERIGEIVASLKESEVAAAEKRSEDPIECLIDGLRRRSMPNGTCPFERLALAHPIRR